MSTGKAEYEEWQFAFCISKKDGKPIPEEVATELFYAIIDLASDKDLSVGGGVSPYREGKKITVAELEKILSSEEDMAIEILPNGEIRAKGQKTEKDGKPLTMRESLGGEY